MASGLNWQIDVYSCLLVCFIEVCSIFGNILKPKGIRIDLLGAARVFAKKAANVDSEDVKCILREDKQDKNDKNENNEKD